MDAALMLSGRLPLEHFTTFSVVEPEWLHPSSFIANFSPCCIMLLLVLEVDANLLRQILAELEWIREVLLGRKYV